MSIAAPAAFGEDSKQSHAVRAGSEKKKERTWRSFRRMAET